MICVEYEIFSKQVVFSIASDKDIGPPPDLSSSAVLDPAKLRQLKQIFDRGFSSHLHFLPLQDPLLPLSEEDKELLWQNRETVRRSSRSLAKLLRSVNWNDPTHVNEVHMYAY